MLEKSSDGDDVGVIIFAERAGRGVPGSMENPTCRILIQRMTRRRSGGRATVRRRRRKNGEED